MRLRNPLARIPHRIKADVGLKTMFTDADIPKRKPVWNALSELWLDTELQDADHERISNVMVQSGYSICELREIYLFEVAPIVSPNLMSMAGEWAGFDEEWLHGNIIKFCKRKGPWIRFFVAIGIGKWFMTWATERHWMKLVKLVEEKRSQPATAPYSEPAARSPQG